MPMGRRISIRTLGMFHSPSSLLSILHDVPVGGLSSATASSTAPHTGVDRISDWSHIMSMKTLAAAKFKEQCLSILDHLEPDGLVITKHGKPVARILPAGRASADLIGDFRG